MAECVLSTKRPMAFDLVKHCPQTSRFVIVDNYEIAGGGIIQDIIHDKGADYRGMVLSRNLKWDFGRTPKESRRIKYGHSPALVLVGGPEE